MYQILKLFTSYQYQRNLSQGILKKKISQGIDFKTFFVLKNKFHYHPLFFPLHLNVFPKKIKK